MHRIKVSFTLWNGALEIPRFLRAAPDIPIVREDYSKYSTCTGRAGGQRNGTTPFVAGEAMKNRGRERLVYLARILLL